MSNSYKEIYNKLIGEKFNTVVIRYSPEKGKYEYRGFSHHAEKNALDNIANLIIDDMIFYAFSENEILRLNDDIDLLEDLRAAAKYAYIERLPKREKAKSDGTMGEVLLDIIIQLASQNTKKLIARAKHTEIKNKKEITGYDALYFTKDAEGISLWLGQAKAGQKAYCKRSIIKDLQEKYKREYFADTAFYIADKNEAPELGELLNDINKICLMAQMKKWNGNQKIEKLFEVLKAKQVKIKIPCLITYSQNIYFDKAKLKEYVEHEVKEILDEFDSQIFPIEIETSYEIVFYIIPVEDVDYIRDKIIELKKEATKMKYLYELVDLLNQYDGSNREMENRIRDLVCYISDSSEYMQIDLYRSIVFEAAQKLRMFGYIKGTNRIAQDEFFYDNLNDIKHSAIQNYYKSKVFSNNLLDKRQKEVIDKFMSLEQKRILVSAPTSFGKTFLLREIIFLNRERYRNILLLFPTIALLNENTESVNQLIQELKLEYKIINNVYSGIEDTEKHIFILTPERALKLLADNANLSIDFFFFDEVYKIDEDFDRNEDSNEKEGEEDVKQDNGNRAKAFRIVLYLLAKSVKEYYLAGPYLNLNQVKKGMQIFLKDNNITPIQIEFEPTSRIEIDAWKMNGIEYHPILGEIKKQLYAHAGPSTKEKVQGIVKYLQENRLGQAIFYCSTPSNSMKYTRDIIEAFSEEKEKKIPYDFIEHLKKNIMLKLEKVKIVRCTGVWFKH